MPFVQVVPEDGAREFKLTHGSATAEKALAAANRVEALLGRVVNGEASAIKRLVLEDVALLVQFVRDSAP